MQQDFLRVYTQVFIHIQIYGDCPANLNGFYYGKAGEAAYAYLVAGVYTEGLEKDCQCVPAESERSCADCACKFTELFFVFFSPVVGNHVLSPIKNPQGRQVFLGRSIQMLACVSFMRLNSQPRCLKKVILAVLL